MSKLRQAYHSVMQNVMKHLFSYSLREEIGFAQNGAK